MKDLFEGIAWLFEEILFLPFEWLRDLQLDSWFLANILNWIFILVAFAAFLFWMKQLKKVNDDGEEKQDTTAHSFLK
jgi:hypothetical protein